MANLSKVQRFGKVAKPSGLAKSAGKSTSKKRLNAIYKWSRLLHIYVSAALFALLITFCVTGITLNHAEWFVDDYVETEVGLDLPDALTDKISQSFLQQTDAPLAELQAVIAEQYADLPMPSSSHIDHELGEITLDYELPAGYANVLVIENEAVMSYRKGGFFSTINDLHKGRHTGGVWQWVIDVSAGLMLVFAVTGLILMVQNKKRRRLGTWATVFGVITPLVLYWLFVPKV